MRFRWAAVFVQVFNAHCNAVDLCNPFDQSFLLHAVNVVWDIFVYSKTGHVDAVHHPWGTQHSWSSSWKPAGDSTGLRMAVEHCPYLGWLHTDGQQKSTMPHCYHPSSTKQGEKTQWRKAHGLRLRQGDHLSINHQRQKHYAWGGEHSLLTTANRLGQWQLKATSFYSPSSSLWHRGAGAVVSP